MKKATISLLWLVGYTFAQDSSSQPASSQSPSVVTVSGSTSLKSYSGDFGAAPTVPASFSASFFSTVSTFRGNATATGTPSTASSTTTEDPLTEIGGGSSRTRTPTGTSPAQPTNTQPCNNYPEFCTRKYSNITEICAHNSPFTRANNAARNQAYGVTTQLNDGVRMLQGQAHLINGTLRYCHTSCDLLDAGPVEDYLREVTAWVEDHPFDVITIIFGNYDWLDKDSDGNSLVTAANFADPIEKSGLAQYIYQPPKTAMTRDDWPTLGEMILKGKRVVTFIDYNPDTEKVPYMLWEFYNIWETPFSPTNTSFPCDLGRPEGISNETQNNMMYMANHNLNTEINFGGFSVLVPNVANVSQTNAVTGYGSLGLNSQQCTQQWGKPPNFLLVDFYNEGDPSGSVFEVAAQANGVTYNRKCCGSTVSMATGMKSPSSAIFSVLIALLLLCAW